MRTSSSGQDGVVSLVDYRKAVEAATFLRGCLHDPAWLDRVTVEMGAGGEARVAVILLFRTPLIERCLPLRVNLVEVVLRDAAPSSRGGGGG